MFETDRFIQDCCGGLRETNAHAAIRDIVARAGVEPREVLTSLGKLKLSGLQTLFRSETLTILNVLWGPGMSLYPHDHRMWAVIGIYSGREDNTFFQRSETGLRQHGGKTLNSKETIPLGEAVIHAVTNPLDQITAAIHVYAAIFSPFRGANGTHKRCRSDHLTWNMPKKFLQNQTSASRLP
jgi:predicted metal-dependent enzyme (double-stranded beta helix superfamily)